MAQQKLRIFISSPGDVGQERLIATRVVARLQGEFAGYAELEPILWEHEPLRATSHFQEQIVPPSQTDIVVCILWSRLGTRLPDQFQRDDGSSYASGTEWEFEDAAKSFLERGAPDLMVYRKTSEAVTALSDEKALLDRLQQKKALDAFIDRWFGNAQDTFKAAFHAFNSPDAFEDTLENHLRNLIRERLPKQIGGDEGGSVPISWHKGSPYRGLEVFDVEHAPVFFGRTRSIGEIKDALVSRAAAGCAFLLVFGMSGSGKSSLIRAGVLPTLTQPGVAEGIGLWRWCIFRPSDSGQNEGGALDIYQGLAQEISNALPELAADGVDAYEFAQLLHEAPQRALSALRHALQEAAKTAAEQEQLEQAPEARLAIVIDQMEELFTLDALDVETRDGWVQVLAELSHSGLAWIIGTMRSDFYARCADIPALIALKEGAGQYDLLPPTFAEIRQIIVQPTRVAGLRFQVDPANHERLEDVLHEAAAQEPEALPLLEFTLDELYLQRTSEGILTFDAYRKMGGLEGALTRRAEDTFLALAPEVQKVLPEVLRALVSLGSEGDLLARRRVPVEILANTPQKKTLVDAFIAARLLVTDRAENGETVIGVAHEALLRHWARLQQWLAEDREFLLTRDRVAAAAKTWIVEKKASDTLLHEGKALTEAADILARRRADLDPILVEYIETSQRKWRNARRRKWFSIGAVALSFFVVISGFGIFSYGQWQRAEKQKKLALTAVNSWTRDIPDKLKDVPGTLPVLREIFEKNVGVLDQIIALNPNTQGAQREKAMNYEHSGDTWRVLGATTTALESYEKSFAILSKLAKDKTNLQAQRDLSKSYEHVGDTRLEIGDLPGAAQAYQQDLALTQELSQTNQDDEWQRNLSVAYEKIGDVAWQKGDKKPALDAYQKSFQIRQALAKSNPSLEAQRDLSVSYERLGRVRLALADARGAQEAYDESLKIRQAQAKSAPSIEAQRDLAFGYTHIGDLRQQLGDAPGAIAAYEKSHDILAYLARDKFSVRAQLNLAASYSGLGDIYLALNNNAKALEEYGKAVEVTGEIAKDQTNIQAQKVLVENYASLIWAAILNRQPKLAIATAQKALALAPKQTAIKVNLAHAYMFDNQFEMAVATYLKNEDVPVGDGQTFADVALADFGQFRAMKMTHPEMDRMERLIRQTRQKP